MLLSIERRRFESFAIGKGGIAFKAELFSFDEIDALWFERVHITQYIYWSKAAECDRATLKVRLKARRTLSLGFNESYFFIGANINKKEWIEKLSESYLKLSKATFENRLSKYENQLREFGFFVYEGARFNPSDRSVTCKGKRFSVDHDSFLRSYGKIEFLAANPTLMMRVMRKITEETFPSQLATISTLSDSDVLFHLLKKYMRMVWHD
jgi:hypothetical protein